MVNGNRAGDSPSTGGGSNNFMMDGVSTMEPGSNRLMIAVNVESIAEVKVLTSSYQAEYGRSSGLQVTAVTKSGTNRFRGSLYDVERNSDWYSNSQTNILNGDPKTTLKQRDWGYSIGGPVGKPGGSNKLFFFYAQEFQPRTAGNDVVRFRVPTALERQGDFSQTTDNNGNPFPYIKDPLLLAAPVRRDQPGGVLRRRRRARPDSGEPALPDRAEHPQPVSRCRTSRRAGAELQLRADASGAEPDLVAAGGPHRLPADDGAARHLQVRRLGSAERADAGLDSRVQRHADERSGRAALVGDGQLHAQPDDVPRGDLRARARIGRRAAG